ncbi:MAG: hypothetical protein QM628_15520 [Propionicimonas sp.]
MVTMHTLSDGITVEVSGDDLAAARAAVAGISPGERPYFTSEGLSVEELSLEEAMSLCRAAARHPDFDVSGWRVLYEDEVYYHGDLSRHVESSVVKLIVEVGSLVFDREALTDAVIGDLLGWCGVRAGSVVSAGSYARSGSVRIEWQRAAVERITA